MDILSAIILGIVQGVAEFLPISSSGHLAIAEHLLGMSGAAEIPEFFDDEKKLLQLLYDCNVITAVETDSTGRDYFHFSYN